MTERQISRGRTLAGLALAIVVAPVATALSIEIMLTSKGSGTIGLSDQVGGGLTFLVLALVFGSVLAAAPGVILGGLTIAIARLIGTRSLWFYAVAGLLAGALMAWIDTGRTKSAFALPDAIPFGIGGCVSALTYWAVAERQKR